MDKKEAIKEIRTLLGSHPSAEKIAQYVEKIIEERDTVKRELKLLESVIRNDYDSIVITELELEKPGPKIVYVNKGFEKITGYKKEEVIGKTPRILQGPKTDRSTLDRLRGSLAQGRPFFGQTINYRKDGSEYLNQWDIHPLFNEDGELTNWVSYQQDITERKKIEKNRVNIKAEEEELYKESKCTIFDIENSGKICFSNRAFQNLVGYEKEELLKMNIWDIMPEKHGQLLKDNFNKFWKNNFHPKKSYRLIFQHKNGKPIQIEANTYVMELTSKHVVRIEVCNISLRKKILNTLKKRNQEFNRIFSSKSDFKYGLDFNEDGQPEFLWVSDDIKNITGYSPEECEGAQGWKKIVHPDDQAAVVSHLKKAEDKLSSCIDYRLVGKDGAVIPVMDYAKSSSSSSDNLKGAVVVVKEKASS